MRRMGLALLALAALAGCGGDDDGPGGLTADEQSRLENIAARLDENRVDFGDQNALEEQGTETE